MGIGAADFETVARQGLGPDAAVLRLPAHELALQCIALRRYIRAIRAEYLAAQLRPESHIPTALGIVIEHAFLEVK